ncbi:MAG: exopolysaccharide biosynthesis protein [Pseudomonadota bacterium]|nr:exopolysaccharide biosynthesis protein [Pseudomonadota bacterium]
MTQTAAVAEENEAARFSEVLRGLAAAPEERLSVHQVVEAFGERAFGALMLFVGLLNLIPWPPGGTTLFGAPLLFITAQLAMGREVLWLPKCICRISFDRTNFARGLKRILPALEKVERLTKPRAALFIGTVAERLIGVAALLLSCVLVLPIWGGNFAPAVAICIFAVALVQRDGVVAIAGWVAVAVSVTVLALAARVIWELGQNAWAWIERLIG